MSKDSILKDTYYKERLARTSNAFKPNLTTLQEPNGEESDTDAVVVSPEEEQLNWQELLKDLGKTTCGTTLAFREVVCTHKRLPYLYVPIR